MDRIREKRGATTDGADDTDGRKEGCTQRRNERGGRGRVFVG
jgi:hypothetical protein